MEKRIEADMSMPTLETPRLRIRPFEPADLQPIHQLLDVELAGVEFGNAGPGSLEQREAWLRWSIAGYEQLALLYQPPYGDRAVVLQETGALAGVCGFVPCLGPFCQLPSLAHEALPSQARFNTAEVGLYYAVSPAYQRKGYAAEAAQALASYAFAQLGLRRIVATTTYDNAGSIGVMRKIGMRVERNLLPTPEWFQVVGILENEEGGERRHDGEV